MLKSLATKFIGWLDRVVDADERVVCALCDERFAGFDEGNVHVRMVHPQYVMGAWQPTVAYGSSTSTSTSTGLASPQPAYAFGSH